MVFKVPEFAAEVDVREAGADMEVEIESNPVVLAGDVSPMHGDDVIDSDSDNDADADDDAAAPSEYSVASSDSEQPREFDEENLNADDDRGSSVDIYESRTPSPPPGDTTLLAVEQTAAVAGAGDALTVPTEAANQNEPMSVPVAENTAVAQRVVPVLDLDNSLSCFKTTKRKKPVISLPVSKEDDVDETEVSVYVL